MLLAPVLSSLLEQGRRAFIEVSPHPVLGFGLQETIDAFPESVQEEAVVLETLRREDGGPGRFSLAQAQAHAAGLGVDWAAAFKGTDAKAVPLPTYPFQRKRYWLAANSDVSAGVGSAGQRTAEHPLLGAVIESPEDDGLTLTGRLSLQSHPWLADHAVAGTVLLPGTAFLELALRAGEEVDCELLEELTLGAPLVLSEQGAVQIQVSVSSPGEEGRRELSIHSRREDAGEGEGQAQWTRHAEGVLSPRAVVPEALGPWPPEGAEPIEVEFLYDRLAEHGFEYGPAFQGLSAAWRAGEDVYAEVSLAEEQAAGAERFGIHPALLDAALHASALGTEGAEAKLPFSFSAVSVQGRGATALRVKISPAAKDEIEISLADAEGTPLGRIGSLAVRAPDLARLTGAKQQGLLALAWQEVSLPAEGSPEAPELFHCRPDPELSPPAAALALSEAVLTALQENLGKEEETPLAFLTKGAIATAEAESADPPAAAAWGLIRSAQSEHPGRFALIDTDGSAASEQALPRALALTEEPQLALREGRALAGRVGAMAALPEPSAAAVDPGATVLITGATGGLGALVAQHLVNEHGARHLLLVSRAGANAPGANDLVAVLEEQGAEVQIAACDVGERDQLEALLDSIPAEHPLGAVIHAAGVLDDATITSLSPDQLERVFAPKANAAWALHELCADKELSAFVMFSSLSGVLGGPGQGNYAAANAFLDALAAARHSEGLPATSIAWGLWESTSGMTSHLGEAELARIRRLGLDPISHKRGLELFDQALAAPAPLALAVPVNRIALRAAAATGALPPMLSGLVGPAVSRRRVGSLVQKLAALAEREREAFVLDLVRGEVAAVLGHDSAAEVEPERAFKELGFDSLAAVELRNRLGVSTGLRLPATTVFDYPNSAALATHLLSEAVAGGTAARVAVRARATEEPIAILGMSCRYPGGVTSPQELWHLVAEGRDAISEFPSDRGWDLERLYDPDPDRPGTSYTSAGGFMAGPGDFDSEFFGLAPREALASDPQQRLLLEAAWEALEDAGVDPASLRESSTGVFTGVMYQDYASGSARPAELEGYLATGASGSIVSGRVAYTFGLEGPAITIDTACSSSLVALHLAAQALRGGECDLALAGGVTVLATPSVFTEFSRQRGLAPDGRCKAFAESADGTGFSEGVGVLALERLSDAQRNGHPVLAVIKGSAVNQDGASNGLTAPNGPSQERVIRQALANAGLEPADVDAVEAHGTGTTLGDPIEAGALLATYGQDRETPLRLGSIKSNIGHTQAAAGVAGVIKTVLAMREGVLPKTLHVDAPSSKVDWEAGQIELLREAEPWEPNERPRRAAVSSFGISGTNAHLILEEGPASGSGKTGTPGSGAGASSRDSDGQALFFTEAMPFPLSAKSEPALRAQAERLISHLQAEPELEPLDLAYSLATTRALFEHRAVALAEDREQLLEALGALAAGADAPGLAKGIARTKQGPAFLFGGQGAQHPGMGVELLDSSPAFARHMRSCEEALSPFVEFSLEEVLRDEQGRWLDRLDIVQPALFATMVSLARLWEDFGVRPAVVVGHSQGEIAAAHIAGGLSLEDAARIIARRGKAMAKLAGKGGMLAVSLSPEELGPRLEPFGERLSLAAINGPASLVVSGDPEPLAELQAACLEDDVRAQPVAVDYAAHSAQIEALRTELLEAFEPISPTSGSIPFHSTVTGELLDTAELGPEYWYRNLRQTVLLAPVLSSLLEQGRRAFIEVSPHPVLGFGLQETIDAFPESVQEEAVVLETLRREDGGPGRFSLAQAQAHAAGLGVDWAAAFKGTDAKAVPLPTYPFQRKRYWLAANSDVSAGVGSAGQRTAEHPLLGAVIESPEDDGLTLTGRLSLQSHPWLADHAVAGTVLLPGTAFLELALRAGEEVDCELLEELTLGAPLVLSEQGAVQIQVSVSSPGEEGRREISIHSRREDAGEGEGQAQWTRHAEGVLSPRAVVPEALGPWPPEGAEPIEVEFLYDRLAEHGFEYGPAFQGLSAAWRAGEDVYAEVSLAEEQAAGAERFGIHPALLDAALHAGVLKSTEEGSGQGLKLPFAWGDVSIHRTGASRLRVRLRPQGEDGTSILIADEGGETVARIGSLTARPVDAGALEGAARRPDPLLALEWVEVELEGGAEPPFVLEGEDLDPLRAAIEAGAPVPKAVFFEPGSGDSDSSAGSARNARAAVEAGLRLIQRWLAAEDLAGSRLVVLTRGAVAAAEGESPDPAAAALWGLLRSAQSEHPGRFSLIDGDGSETSVGSLSAAAALEDEPQLALREGVALAPRVVPAVGPGGLLLPPAGPWRLDSLEPGSIDGLALIPNPRAREPLGPGEVRISVRAAGLNFRDVLATLSYAVPGAGIIGGEIAGVVAEVGSEVSHLQEGDRVMGTIKGGVAPLAVGEAGLFVRMPDDWSFEQAAAMPIVFPTAFYGLVDLAALRPGEKVLIHAAAGGVGLAAIGLARHLGAEVFATASPSKWEVLRRLGIEEDHLASSRDLDFKQKFLDATAGDGMDVVLNSLAGEFADASLALLPRGGRFLEMGKADVRDAERVAADHPGVSYLAYDIFDMEPEPMGEMLGEITGLFESGALRHSPITRWDVRDAQAAFRHLREGKNVGKVVLEMPLPLDPERTTLITGGTGGLGALVARHLVAEHGACHLLLASRSGEKAEGAVELAAELEGLGAKVTITACDVAERGQLEDLLRSVPGQHPLGAVIHTAGVLEDATIDSLDPGLIERVFAPKADAAWHLHELTAEMELSAFVLFSSMAGTLGGPGQGNYAAANSFLDALATRRRADSLPGTSIAWGLWPQDSGLTSQLGEAELARMRRSGIVALSDEQGLAFFDQALVSGLPQMLAARLDRAGLQGQASARTLPAILRGLVRAPSRRRSAAAVSLSTRLAALAETERESFILELVRAEVATVLGHGSAEAIDPDRAFKELGFDSLAAVELRNRLKAATGLRLPATVVFDYPNSAALGGQIHAMAGRSDSSEGGGDEDSLASGFDRLETMLAGLESDDRREEAAARLRALLAGIDGDQETDLADASDEEIFDLLDKKLGQV